MNNLALYVHFSKLSRLKKFEKYNLLALKEDFKIVLISNSTLEKESIEWLATNNIDLILRENNGFDIGAFVEYFRNLKEPLNNYNHILLTNNSYYGPIHKLEKPHVLLDGKDLFGWYLHPSSSSFSQHLQSYFLLFGPNIIKSNALLNFFSDLKIPSTFEEAIQLETQITQYFIDLGFTIEYRQDYLSQKKLFPNVSLLLPDFFLRSGVPIIKRKALLLPYSYFLENSFGDHTQAAIRSIRNSAFPADLIFDDLLDFPQSVTFPHLGHFFILDKGEDGKKQNTWVGHKICLILYCYFEDLCEQNFRIIDTFLSLTAKVLVVSSKDSLIEIYKNKYGGQINCEIIKNRGRNEFAYFVSGKPYIKWADYCCLLHDKKSNSESPAIRGYDWNKYCIDNLVCSKSYILNVLQKFQEHPEIGLLFPPPPSFSKWKNVQNCVWENGNNVKWANKLYELMGLKAPMDRYPLVPYGSMFWLRKGALQPLLNLDLKVSFFPQEPLPPDGTILHALERLYSLIAQDAGYFSGWIMNKESAERYLINQYYYTIDSNCNSVEPGLIISGKLFAKALKRTLKRLKNKLWKKTK